VDLEPLNYAGLKTPDLNRRHRERVTIGLLIALLAFLIYVVIRPYEPPRGREEAWRFAAAADVATLSGQLNSFAVDTGRYPTAAEG
jgi:hypothetical protein